MAKIADDDLQAGKVDDADLAPEGKEPSPTGWRDAAKKPDLLDQVVSGKEREEPYMWGALAAGAHGAAHAMEGPFNGAVAAVKQDLANLLAGKPLHPDVSPSDAYYKEKNRIEGEQKQNLKDFPNAPIVGALMTAGAGTAPSALGRIGTSGLQGAVYGLGSSKHDMGGEKADPVGVALDTAKSGLVGVGAGVGGEALNAGAKVVGNKLGAVLDKNLANAQALADKIMRSARGTLGAEVSSGSRVLEVLEEAAKGTNPNVDPALRAAAQQFLASPEAATLRNQVVRSSLGRAADQTGRIQNARDELVNAIDNQSPEAVQAAAKARLNDSSAMWRRIREIGPKIVLPALGAWFSGPEGAAAGGLAAAVLGRSGTAIRNGMADPYVASRVLTAGSAALGGAGNAISHSASPLAAYLDLLDDPEKK